MMSAQNSPKAGTIVAIAKEVDRARAKFPSNKSLTVALMEEVGELAQAQLQNQGKARVFDEAMQVACVAIRIMEEGDADYPQKGGADV